MDAIQAYLRQVDRYKVLAAYWDLGDHVRWWNSEEWDVTRFLRCPEGCRHITPELHGNPLFQAERLANLHYAALAKLFHADVHCTRLKDALHRLSGDSDAHSYAFSWSIVDDAMGAFFWSLAGSLDALAGEAALIMGYTYSACDAQLSVLKAWMRERPRNGLAPLAAQWTEMGKTLRQQFRRSPRRWSDDLQVYRNWATHRPFIHKQVRITTGNQVQSVHLPTDPLSLPSDSERRRAYRREDVRQYFDSLWNRVAETLGQTHRVLLETYKAREAGVGDTNDCSLHWDRPPKS